MSCCQWVTQERRSGDASDVFDIFALALVPPATIPEVTIFLAIAQ
jgi:hypothetical protein